VDELYVLARRVLLDALEALGPHRSAVVLAGAQAIYLRVGEADVAVAPFTTDGDLVVEPSVLGERPPLEQVLSVAGFQPGSSDSVGIWITHRALGSKPVTVAVDFLVPAALSPGKGRRAARLPGHDAKVARIVMGLEGALVDLDLMELGALEESDPRSFEIRVAGPAALLVSKMHKIADRRHGSRLHDKDALDAFRLLRGVTTEELADRMRRLLSDPSSAATARQAIEILEALFGARSGGGAQMVVRSTAGLADGAEMALACELLTRELLSRLK
jgi:hypothetical protein